MFQYILILFSLIPNKLSVENHAYKKLEEGVGFSLDVFPSVRVYNVHQSIISLLVDVLKCIFFFNIMILIRLSFDDKYPY